MSNVRLTLSAITLRKVASIIPLYLEALVWQGTSVRLWLQCGRPYWKAPH